MLAGREATVNDVAAGGGAQGRAFLAQAAAEFALRDYRQASEKGWGAAAQVVKAVAAERGWDHGRHGNLYQAVRRLVDETGEEDLRRLFGLAGELHSNFYEGFLAPADVEGHLADVTRFVDRVERLLANGA